MSPARITTIAFAALAACSDPSRAKVDAMVADTLASDADIDAPIDAEIDAPIGSVECPPGAELVYTIDRNGRMYRFDPATKVFVDHGVPGCASGQGVTPWTMGVDRFGWAWIRYTNGQLFKVHLSQVPLPNHTCQPVPFTPPTSDLTVFGMGFSTDTVGGSSETLYISGCDTIYLPSECALARIDPATLALTRIGTPSYLAEMTGNQNGELWGFMPGTTAKVARFDKATGAEAETFLVPELNFNVEGWLAPWAFAHWGGHYWIFLEWESLFTNVHELDPSTGTIVSTTETQRTIVGAGVSTCAPTVIL